MYYINIVVFIAAVFVGFAAETSCSKPKIACAYNQYAFSRTSLGFYNTENIPEDQCTHLIYASVGVNNINWILRVKEESYDVTSNGFQNFTNLKQHFSDTKFLITVREVVSILSDMASEKSRRTIFIDSMIEFIKYYNFDGIDIFWEFPGKTYGGSGAREQDKNNYLYLLQEMRRAFDKHNKDWQITILAPAYSTYINEGFHVYEMCQLVDAVHLKTFDLRATFKFTDVFSPLYLSPRGRGDPKDVVNVNDGVQIWLKRKCPAHKLLLGLPFYGRSYKLVDKNQHGLGANTTGEGVKGIYTNYNDILAFYEICSYLAETNSAWTRGWDEQGKVPYAYKDDMWMSYEDEESIQLKIDWLKDKGLSGIYIYSIDFDDFRGLCGPIYPLLNSIRANLQEYEVPVSNTPTTPLPVWLRAPTTEAT